MLSKPEAPLSAVSEAFSTSRDGAATGLMLAELDALGRTGKPLLWVQDTRAAQEAGVPCIRGLAALNMPLLRVAARNAAEALWAMEEGLECTSLSAVVGEVWGSPKALDFTATKRLSLRARRSGVPLWLLRPDAQPDLSVAPKRWRVASAPSAGNVLDPRAPGKARWTAELFRARGAKPGTWVASHDRAAHRLDLVAPVRHGTVGEGASPPNRRTPYAVGGGRAGA